MKVAITYRGGFEPLLSHDALNCGIGGTDSEIIQLAENYAKNGHEIHVMGSCIDGYDHGVLYSSNIEQMLSTNKYDYIIVECGYRDLINLIEKQKSTECIFLFHCLNELGISSQLKTRPGTKFCLHSPGCANYNSPLDYELRSSLIKAFICLSEQHKEDFSRINNIPIEKIEIVPNGIDVELFNFENDHKVDHSIFWSSNLSRGLDILANKIFPLVKQKIPDFSIIASSPSYSKYYNQFSNVKYIGNLNKIDLYNEMAKHACWFYPASANETFCITSIENAMCGTDLIFPLVDGMATTFKTFPMIGMKYRHFNGNDFYIEASNRIIDSILNYHNVEKIQLRTKIQNYIQKNYNFSVIIEKFNQLFFKFEAGNH